MSEIRRSEDGLVYTLYMTRREVEAARSEYAAAGLDFDAVLRAALTGIVADPASAVLGYRMAEALRDTMGGGDAPEQ